MQKKRQAKRTPVMKAAPPPVDPSLKATELPKNADDAAPSFYASLVESLTGMPSCYPVYFNSLRHRHMNGDVENKKGIFVRIFDIHDLDRLESENIANETKYDSPAVIIKMAAMSACAFDGSRLFDEKNEKHLELLTAEGKFTEDIWYRTMYANGFYERVVTQVAKNSEPTVKPASDSGSVSN